ncbi:MAG: hypothetical protein JW727_03430 [Candidatus Aenigmarchaeota archaeon]|nr:hypothetical protein [Candidatus Aenigmarchaeota archaeon]
MPKLMVLYVPVIHKGYLELFERHKGDAEALYVIGANLAEEIPELHMEIRALSPETAAEIIGKMETFKEVKVLSKENLGELENKEIICGSDTVSRSIAEKYLPKNKVEFDTMFLRWDASNVLSQTSVSYDRASESEFDRKMMEEAKKEADKSSDWWRHVGSVIVKDGKVIIRSHNTQVPSEHAPYINGDPRDSIKAGTNPEYASAIHSEQRAIAEATRKGISLDGTDLYLTVFPCPSCAKLIAYSGIRRVFFLSGHASLDGESILKSRGIELVFVK